MLFRCLTIGAFVVLGPIICIGIATALFSFLKVQKAPSEENILYANRSMSLFSRARPGARHSLFPLSGRIERCACGICARGLCITRQPRRAGRGAIACAGTGGQEYRACEPDRLERHRHAPRFGRSARSPTVRSRIRPAFLIRLTDFGELATFRCAASSTILPTALNTGCYSG